MTFSTLMVHVEPGQTNTGLLNIAGDLAERLNLTVIGITACQPCQIMEGDGEVPGALIEADRVEIAKEIVQAEAEFRNALQHRVKTLEWRALASFQTLCDFITQEARCADVIITRVGSSELFDGWRRVDVGALTMQAGRPVVIVPDTADRLVLDHVLIAWKDTRESRRAVFDALPILKVAKQVTVVEIAVEGDMSTAQLHVQDVTLWLKRHGIDAKPIVSPSTGNDAYVLNSVAEQLRSDLIVAGAYSHSRLREFILGGVTHDLLLCPNRCSFVSH